MGPRATSLKSEISFELMKQAIRQCQIFGLLLLFAGSIPAKEKFDIDAARAKYDQKFATVLGSGLSAGYCEGILFMGLPLPAHSGVAFIITDGIIRKLENPFRCPIEPLRKGEVLLVDTVAATHKILVIGGNLPPRALTRGIGAFEHESIEVGRVGIGFSLAGDTDSAISQWLSFTDVPDFDKLTNTAGFAIVKQVKLGMSPTQVEDTMGIPQARIDLDRKFLYKYKNMTVEFHDGKVTDVR